MSNYVSTLKSNGVLTNNMIWIKVNGDQYWNTSCTDNQNWLSDAISAADSSYSGCGLTSCVGIYTSSSDWNSIMCNTSQFSGIQLWWKNIDAFATFSGWFFLFFFKLLV